MKKISKRQIIQKFIWIGTLTGFIFYFLILLIDLDIHNMGFTFSNVGKLHFLNPIIWAFDLLPFFITTFAFYIGKLYAQNYDETHKSVELELKKSNRIVDFTENLRNGNTKQIFFYCMQNMQSFQKIYLHLNH